MVDIKTLDLTDYTAEELKILVEKIKTVLSDKRKAVLAEEKKAKETRAERYNRSTVAKGDTINFLFNKKLKTGFEVVNVNEKSVTVEIEGKKKYIKYENIIAITSNDSDSGNTADNPDSLPLDTDKNKEVA